MAATDRYQQLTDAQWARLEPLLPSSDGRRGRPFRNSRQILEGVIYRYRTGIPWRDLPEHFGPWQTVWKRHRRYTVDGTWDRILTRRTRPAPSSTRGAQSNYRNQACSDLDECEPAGHGVGRSRGGLSTKIHHAVDGKGRPLSVVVTGGQRNDGSMLQVVIDDIRVPQPAGRSGRPRTTPDAVMADRAYPSRANREYLRDRGIAAVIPEKVDHVNARKRKGSAGGRPPKMDWEAYKGRNVVERSFNLLKQWRGLATRYDKLAVIYRGAAVLAAIVAWLKALGDTP
jgi:transposase